MAGQEHPRARGENLLAFFFLLSLLGTSPRTRGKRCPAFPQGLLLRNIPAHAGKTQNTLLNLPRRQEHPRARGENCSHRLVGTLQPGTSPRTRGKRLNFQDKILARRNIPAHAGKTFTDSTVPARMSEHPRARGENVVLLSAGLRLVGTSPRTRGKPRPQRRNNIHRRNIPAHAGKTFLSVFLTIYYQEHPRARGENVTIEALEYLDVGTSPRTRGKRHRTIFTTANNRNIPAHAGKTPSLSSGDQFLPEHPRARGENL